jgi:diguanylate cyclase (GGDEF)-like protein/PAS domain S-box-containing protein
LGAIHLVQERAVSDELESSVHDLRINYNIISHKYQVAAEAIRYSILEHPEVKEIIARVYHVDEHEKALLRKKLYDVLYKEFQTYKKLGVKLILFTQPDNRVFLRMHKPEIYDDDISNIRFGIAEVNKTHQAMSGFEQGKISHAFRYIYPVFDATNQYVGCIDISFSSEKLQESLRATHKLQTNFLVNKNVIDRRIWTVKNVTSPYTAAIENGGYMSSKQQADTFQIDLPEAKKIIAENRALIDREIKASKAFAVYGDYGSDDLVISFLPIHSILPREEAAAYLVSYTANTQLTAIQNEYLIIKIITVIAIALLLWQIYSIILQKKEALLTSNVFSHMNDGIVITDAQNRIIRVNEAYLKITQYTEEELIGQNPNFVKSGWHDSGFYAKMWEEILSGGSWSGEVVDRKKDGSLYNAESTIIAVKNSDGAITNYIAVTSDITARKEQESIINNLAYYDVLTQLPNKTYFSDLVNARIAASKRHGNLLALLFIDLDNFKSINDTYGHLTGDRFLKESAQRIRDVLREEDVLSRFGGDEFVIMVEGFKQPSDLALISEKIVNAFELPIGIDEIEVFSGASIGISLYPQNAATLEELLRTADTAMYHVKNSGKSGFRFFQESMNEAMASRMAIEHALRTSIEHDEFYLTYQPKIDLSTNRVYGMEALLRWEHPELGFISPEVFIPIAEENGKIHTIGKWVLKEALKDSRRLQEEGIFAVVSVNVSSLQLEREDFVKELDAIIGEVGIAPHYIELEITETEIMKDIETSLSKLKEMTSKGIGIAIDDFGTGYSSLAQLKKLPASTVKIDKSFVLDIDKDSDDREMVSSMIQLSHTFNKDVVAEGSETREHIEILRQLGCHKVQGYYYSKPLKYGAFKEFVKSFNHL